MNQNVPSPSPQPTRLAERREALTSLVRSCLESRQPPEVNLSLPRHAVITPVLRRFVYDSTYRGRSIPVIFRDGSRPTSFPIGCLSERSARPPDRPVVNLGLCSLRHPEMDYLVDLYLTRNRDLNDQPTMAAEEELSYRRAVELLDDPALSKGGLIRVFHTGLEPMIVGFYRGVVEVLGRQRRPWRSANLVVQPLLFMRKSEKTGLSPASPGAQLESYQPAEIWG